MNRSDPPRDPDAQAAPDSETRDSDTRIQTVCLVILAAVAIAGAAYWLRPVLVPFVVALFVVIGLTPLVELLTVRLHLPRLLAAMLALGFGIVLLAVLGLVVSLSLGQPAANAELYQQRTDELITQALDALDPDRFGVERREVRQQITDWFARAAGDLLLTIGRAVRGILSNGTLVLIFVGFLMLGSGRRQPDAGDRSAEWREIEGKVKRYIVVKVLLSVVTGVLVGLSLWLLGVDMAVLFGLLAFLLNFIPSIGSIIAVFLPIPVVLVSPDMTGMTVVLAILLPGGVEMLIGNVIEPRLMGKTFGLHPIAVLMALIFWGMLWGVIGMLLATPMTAIARVLLARHTLTRPAADLLAGRIH